jgi:alcohol dehydrogenase (cytochrome c)
MRRNFRKGAVTIIIALIGIVACSYYFNFLFAGNAKTWSAISWRAQILLKKAYGGVPELSWAELWKMISHQGGFGLQNSFVYGQSVVAAVSNPYTTPEDREAGGRIFRQSCERCHGENGKGGLGPSLVQFGYKNGDSELAIDKVLAEGIVGTPMVPANLSFSERWQVIGYLRNLQLQSGNGDNEVHPLNIQVSSEQILKAIDGPAEWLSYSGSLSGWRYSALSEITPANVAQLRVRWVRQSSTNDAKFESTPLVVGNTIFITEPPATVVALDAPTGKEIWRYARALPVGLPICCGNVNRGLAILDNSLFLGALDGYLVAINANTGKVKWQTRVARSSDGFSITGAPLIVNRSVVTGVAGGEYGIRGFLAAYDATNGQLLWKFDTIPGPGQAGHDTWQNEAWRAGGGSTWVTGSYDPSLDLLYWGVGNPSPPFFGEEHPGDNLFTNSVVALHATSGRLAWYFQFTPHDEHDWDAAQTPILADLFINGSRRRVICWPNRNGFYYVLDRVTGQFLLGTPFVEINWAQGLTSLGRPIPMEASTPNEGGRITKPSVAGGVNWQPSAFDRTRGLIFIPANEGASVFTKSPPDRLSRGENGFFAGSGGSVIALTNVVRALDAATGAKRWEYHAATGSWGGLLATAGGLVFGTSGESLFALDAATGKEMWRVGLGGATWAPPISFTADGKQVIAVSAGRAMFVFGL